ERMRYLILSPTATRSFTLSRSYWTASDFSSGPLSVFGLNALSRRPTKRREPLNDNMVRWSGKLERAAIPAAFAVANRSMMRCGWRSPQPATITRRCAALPERCWRRRRAATLHQFCCKRCRRDVHRYQTQERDRECTRSRELVRAAARVQPAFMLADLPSARQARGERSGV